MYNRRHIFEAQVFSVSFISIDKLCTVSKNIKDLKTFDNREEIGSILVYPRFRKGKLNKSYSYVMFYWLRLRTQSSLCGGGNLFHV